MMRSLLGTLPLLLLMPSLASAQGRFNPANSFGVGIGLQTGPGVYGPRLGPSSTLFFTHYPGFYGNGFSLYGPPVPTYGAIPGVFGGADQKLFPFPPHYPGYNWLGYRSPSPRPRPNFNYVAPGNFIQEPTLEVVQRELPIIIEVIVPADAKVYVDDHLTKQTGAVRTFISPKLPTNNTYTYTVRAEWPNGEKPMTKTSTLIGKPGERASVDFVTPR